MLSKLVLLLVTCYLLLLLTTNYQASTIYAQSACQDTLNPRAGWLVSAKSISVNSKFKSLINPCTLDTSGAASFGTGFIDTYSALKTKYFTNPGGTTILNGGSITISSGNRYQTQGNSTGGNLTVSGINALSTGAALIFVDGNLIISGSLNYGGNNSDNTKGIVFVVRDNVIIHANIGTIDAFIIAAGPTSIVCTGTTDINNNTSCPPRSSVNAGQLIVNGSLISLSSAATPITFNITLGASNPTVPAEKFNFQPKYYVLFKDLFSDSRQTRKEVAGVPVIP